MKRILRLLLCVALAVPGIAGAQWGGLWNNPAIPTNTATDLTVGTTTVTSGTDGRVLYDNAGVVGEFALGTGVRTALGVNTGSAGAFVVYGGALGTPSSGTATNLSGTAASLTAGAATVLATTRAIYGNNFDGSAALTQIIASTYGGTGNGFTKFSGPASTEKTFTLPNASATLSYTVASGAKALATSSISSGACSSAQTDTATGTLTTDTIMATFSGDPTATTGYAPTTNGGLHIVSYPTADTVNFKVCNNTSASITPGAVTLNWRVVR